MEAAKWAVGTGRESGKEGWDQDGGGFRPTLSTGNFTGGVSLVQ